MSVPLARPRILVTGANGQVGFELQRALALVGEVVAVDRQRCDLADANSVRRCVRAVAPSVIVNAGAHTAVDRAQSEPDLAYAVNATAVGVLAEEAKALGASMVHYSTDYVFDGEAEGWYGEADATNPLGVYGASKLAGEQAMADVLADANAYWVLRTTWVFGLHGGNFLKTMLRLGQQRDQLSVVADQIGAPTSAALIADVTARLLLRRPDAGVYHLAAAGETSWHGYAQRVLRMAAASGLPLRVDPEAVRAIPASDYPTPARRPANSRLNCEKLSRALDLTLPDWSLAVDQATRVLLGSRQIFAQ